MRWRSGAGAAAAGALLIALAVLAYGAWQAHTHATLWIHVQDRATGRSLNDATLVLRDAVGGALARATLTAPLGLPRYEGEDAVDCTAEERSGGAAWHTCFDAQSRWLSRWAERSASADVVVGTCRLDRLPLIRQTYSDWWFWWVPLPHIGGAPQRHVSLRGALDSVRCQTIAAPP
jgi:hypothetical protein